MRHVRCFLRYVYGLAMRPTRGGCEDGYADASGLVLSYIRRSWCKTNTNLFIFPGTMASKPMNDQEVMAEMNKMVFDTPDRYGISTKVY